MFVACDPTDPTVVIGYYALAAASIRPADAATRTRKGVARQQPIPAVLLARLGVDTAWAGKGLGAALVKDALLRAASASGQIGARAFLIHCENVQARSFYLHLAEFEPSPSDPLHLMLPITDIARAATGE